jgi:type IV pilus assembly protein PilO
MKFGIRELLFILVLLGVLGSAYFFIFSRANARIAALDGDTLSKQRTLADLKNATSGIEDMGRKIDEIQTAIEYFHNKLPPQREVDTILQQVSQISQSSGLATHTVKPDKSTTNANYSEEPIELSLSGSFEGFYQFLLQLEKLPRLTRLTQMRLTKIDATQGQMTAELTLSIYFAPDSDDGGNATASAGGQ